MRPGNERCQRALLLLDARGSRAFCRGQDLPAGPPRRRRWRLRARGNAPLAPAPKTGVYYSGRPRTEKVGNCPPDGSVTRAPRCLTQAGGLYNSAPGLSLISIILPPRRPRFFADQQLLKCGLDFFHSQICQRRLIVRKFAVPYYAYRVRLKGKILARIGSFFIGKIVEYNSTYLIS